MEKYGNEYITSEIISWLPVKSIVRFKCVCKAWNTWIEHPNFSKLQLARSQGLTRLLFELYPCKSYRSKKKKKQRRLERYSLEFTRRFYFEDMFICSNHCNGLVCLYSSKDGQVYLFNVSTREFKALPVSVEGVRKNSMDPRLYLGFDKGKLIVRCGRSGENVICNDPKKDFTEFVDYHSDDISEKVVILETEERTDRPTETLDAVLATASIINAPTSLLNPELFRIVHVSSFVDNVIPLTSLF
uniref:F-box domain-containing protein n=1 Tax=Solanum lycopersicum TaxID=4081 RepID=A0A3Q7GEX7_SOLLC|nr:putative F-box protein At3g10240 [Solanum lycopersicum]